MKSNDKVPLNIENELSRPPIVNWIIPMKTVSETNLTEHWTIKRKRHQLQKLAIFTEWNRSGLISIPLPCKIILTRIAPRSLDYDNLVGGAMKHIRDAISDIIIPNKRAGFADSSPFLSFEYEQRKGLPKEYAIQIQVFHTPVPNCS